ncbi:MAG TPA: hypothetical protein VHE56_12350 [Mycobacteriales bacterium]|nr:hypothetical protein [Mycobacteriales bacterium]
MTTNSRWSAAIAGVAATAVIAGAVVAGVRTAHLATDKSNLQHSLSSFERSALQAAKTYAVTFATYRYDDLDADFAATEAHSVDPFLTQYRSTTDALRETVTKVKASSSAKVVSAGLASITADSAVVDLFLDQSIVNVKSSRTLAQRVEMTLVRKDGRWLISRVVLP